MEASFEEAIALAREIGTKLIELRVTTSLARFLAGHGRADESRARLAPLYSWFTEGFDAPDLQDAKALLEEVGWTVPVAGRPGFAFCCEPHTIAYMRDAVLTIRVPQATRQRIELLARREGRSLSQQAERLLERGLQAPEGAMQATPSQRGGLRSLAGALAGGRVPTLEECRQVRTRLSRALAQWKG